MVASISWLSVLTSIVGLAWGTLICLDRLRRPQATSEPKLLIWACIWACIATAMLLAPGVPTAAATLSATAACFFLLAFENADPRTQRQERGDI